jgi:arsenite/tail-anchored protein-transporting ATPase
MISIPEFLATAPRHLFFTGKGGVGKTSLACASAVLLADKSRRVLKPPKLVGQLASAIF